MAIIFKQCTIDHLEELREISYITYKDTFEAVNTQETMTSYLEEAFNLAKLEKEVLNPLSIFYLLIDDGTLVGYMKISLPSAQTDFNDPDAMELERIYVKKTYKGRGYGQLMVEKAILMTKAQGLKSLWLGVWEDNTSAKKFYGKFGFVKVGEHGFRMGDEVQTDYIYRKWIT